MSEFDHLFSFHMGGKVGIFPHLLQMGRRITFKGKKNCERPVHQSNGNSSAAATGLVKLTINQKKSSLSWEKSASKKEEITNERTAVEIPVRRNRCCPRKAETVWFLVSPVCCLPAALFPYLYNLFQSKFIILKIPRRRWRRLCVC